MEQHPSFSFVLISIDLCGALLAFFCTWKTYPRGEGVGVGSGRQVDGHDVRPVTVKGLQHLARLDVPKGARGVSGSSQNLKREQAEEVRL